MKRTFTLLLFLATAFTYAQNDRPKTLIGNDPEDISGFGGVLFSFTPIDGELATLTGGGGAILFDNTFFVGGYGLGMTGNRKITVAGENYTTSFDHGGFWLGYVIKPNDLVHFGVDAKLGWGEILSRPSGLGISENVDNVFVFYPQANVEANIAYWFKVNAGLGFQKTIGVDDFHYKSSDFDGVAFSMSLLFGWFN
jgi:hypothetical protein